MGRAFDRDRLTPPLTLMPRPVGPSTVIIALTGGLLCTSLLLVPTGCAWGYAGQSDDERAAEAESDEHPNVVVQKEGDESTGGEGDDRTDSESSTRATTTGDGDTDGPTDERAESACGVETFEIHYYDESTQITKAIDCASRTVVSVKRSPISQQKLQSAEEAGLPEETWYVLVDPKGLRETFLDNDELLRLSREYALQFLGRDEQRNLLIYEYRGDL